MLCTFPAPKTLEWRCDVFVMYCLIDDVDQGRLGAFDPGDSKFSQTRVERCIGPESEFHVC